MHWIYGLFLSFSLFACSALAQQAPPAEKKVDVVRQPVPPISLEILYYKQYPFSPELFDGTVANGRMQLSAAMKNVSGAPVTVSTDSETVIGVNSISYHRFGSTTPRTLRPESRLIEFDDDPIARASDALVTLAPQASVQFPIKVIWKADLTIGRHPTVLMYTPPGSGVYTFAFQYFYIGPNWNFPGVYHFAVTAHPITVQVFSGPKSDSR